MGVCPSKGVILSTIENITSPETGVNQFGALGITPEHLRALDALGITVPTPIQAQAIPVALEGGDLIGIAQTGTGKTLAFGLPILERLAKTGDGVALILAPTRELAIQISDAIHSIGKILGLRQATLIGGAPMHKQVNNLRGCPHVIVATPGRLEDHLAQKTLHLNDVQVVVLDEADRMLDMGFEPAIRRIMALVPKERQTMLFTATLPAEIERLASGFLRSPAKVQIEQVSVTPALIAQELYVVENEDKSHLLQHLIRDVAGPILVFSRTRHGARKLAKSIRGMGHESVELHSDRTLAQRRTALEGFKRGEFQVLVATDIASRGIDVKGITLVVNYDLPDQPEDYVHRIGRTGRAGGTGRSITLATPQQSKDVQLIERLIKQEIPLSEESPLGITRTVRNVPRQGQGGGQKRSNRGRPSPFVPLHKRPAPSRARANAR